MGKASGFMEHSRETATRRPVTERVNDWFEIYQDFPEEKLRTQGARCMDCGVPFCHTGCPVNNLIPDWNDLVYHGNQIVDRASGVAERYATIHAARALCAQLFFGKVLINLEPVVDAFSDRPARGGFARMLHES